MKKPYVLAIASHKGGTGRTTCALAIAWTLGTMGQRVLLVDGNAISSLKLFAPENGDREIYPGVFLGTGKRGEAAAVQADFVVVDSPPVLDEGALQFAARAHGVVLTTLPDPLAFRTIPGATAALVGAKRDNPDLDFLGVCVSVFNSADPLQQEMLTDLRAQLGPMCIEPPIPWTPRLATWGMQRAKDLPAGPEQGAYRELVEALLGRMERTESEAQPATQHSEPTATTTDSAPPESTSEAPARYHAPETDGAYFLAVASHKGGTGRTIASLALAWAFGQRGRQVVLVDGNATPTLKLFDVQGNGHLFENVRLAASPEAVRDMQADIVILDSPPVLDEGALDFVAQANGVILTTLADPLAFRTIPGATAALVRAKETNPSLDFLGVLVNVYRAGDPLQEEMLGELYSRLGAACFETPIPWQQEWNDWGVQPGSELPPGPARESTMALVAQLEARLFGNGATIDEPTSSEATHTEKNRAAPDLKPGDALEMARNLERSPYILAVASHKGGTGRTIATLALAWAFAVRGQRVLVVDGCPVPTMKLFCADGGRELFPGVTLGTGSTAELEELQPDLVILDCPAIFDEGSLDLVGAADGVLLTTLPDPLAFRTIPGATTALQAAKQSNPNLELLGICVSIYDPTDPLQAQLLDDLWAMLGDLCLSPPIPWCRELADWGLEPGDEVPPGEARDAFLAIAEQLEPTIQARRDGTEPPPKFEPDIPEPTKGKIRADSKPRDSKVLAIHSPAANEETSVGLLKTCTAAVCQVLTESGHTVNVLGAGEVLRATWDNGSFVFQDPSEGRGEVALVDRVHRMADCDYLLVLLEDLDHALLDRADGVLVFTSADQPSGGLGRSLIKISERTSPNAFISTQVLYLGGEDASTDLQVQHENITRGLRAVGRISGLPDSQRERYEQFIESLEAVLGNESFLDWHTNSRLFEPMPAGVVRDRFTKMTGSIVSRLAVKSNHPEAPELRALDLVSTAGCQQAVEATDASNGFLSDDELAVLSNSNSATYCLAIYAEASTVRSDEAVLALAVLAKILGHSVKIVDAKAEPTLAASVAGNRALEGTEVILGEPCSATLFGADFAIIDIGSEPNPTATGLLESADGIVLLTDAQAGDPPETSTDHAQSLMDAGTSDELARILGQIFHQPDSGLSEASELRMRLAELHIEAVGWRTGFADTLLKDSPQSAISDAAHDGCVALLSVLERAQRRRSPGPRQASSPELPCPNRIALGEISIQEGFAQAGFGSGSGQLPIEVQLIPLGAELQAPPNMRFSSGNAKCRNAQTLIQTGVVYSEASQGQEDFWSESSESMEVGSPGVRADVQVDQSRRQLLLARLLSRTFTLLQRGSGADAQDIQAHLGDSCDVHFLKGLLHLCAGDPKQALVELETSSSRSHSLGQELSRFGIGLVVSFHFTRDFVAHTGANLRGLWLATCAAEMQLGDCPAARRSMREFIAHDSGDMVGLNWGRRVGSVDLVQTETTNT